MCCLQAVESLLSVPLVAALTAAPCRPFCRGAGGSVQAPKKQGRPHGRALPAGPSVTYDVDARGVDEVPRQLEVTRFYAR